jgi:aryl-alcohol dehydrogenase-like predicted oxidoreductase
MNNNNVSRRSFLLQGGALAGSVALAGSAKATAAKVRVHHPHSLAGTPGQLWIGGDLQVNRMGLGTAEFYSLAGVPVEAASVRRMLRRAIELGVNHVDTADVYGLHGVERFIYEALYPYPSDLVIATKSGQVRGIPGGRDARPEHLRQSCIESMKRLNLEQIPLYYLHSPDPKVPYEDSIGELAKLQKEGKIRHIGVSGVDAAQLAKARSIVKVAAVQNQYDILSLESDDILIDCERTHTAFIPFSPLGGRTRLGPKNLQDALAGKGTVDPSQSAADARLAGFQALADEHHVSLAQIALAWLLARSPVMLPIPGTSRLDHLEDDLAAARIRLTSTDMERMRKLG